MKKLILGLFLLAGVGQMSLAQPKSSQGGQLESDQSIDQALDAELDQELDLAADQEELAPPPEVVKKPMKKTQTVTRTETKTQIYQPLPEAQEKREKKSETPIVTQSFQPQPIYIVNQGSANLPNQAPAAGVQSAENMQNVSGGSPANAQLQPVTKIEAAPLKESKVESIRKARQSEEVVTEQKLAEKLENSRLDGEKKRADEFLTEKANKSQELFPQAQNNDVANATKSISEEKTSRKIVRDEMRTAYELEKAEPMPSVEQRYFAGLLGTIDVPEASNVSGNYVLGAAFGTNVDGFVIEGTFLYANYSVKSTYYSYYSATQNIVTDVYQYSGALAGKYQFLTGLVRPTLGGLVQYSYRTYSLNTNNYYAAPYNNILTTDASSHAFDLGVLTGIDIVFNPRFALGLDYRYYFNLSSRVNSNGNYVYSNNTTPLEKLQYYTLSLVGRVSF
jgi:hypothetical protein